MNSIVNPLIYFYRNHRFSNIVLEILCIRKPPVTKSKVAPMQYVGSKDPFSKRGIQKHPNANSHHLLSRSASCELANVIGLNRAMKKRPVSAPSIIRLHSNSFDSSQPQNPSSILTVVATVHPQRPERHLDSLPIFHPSSLTKRWEAKRNHFNLSDPARDLIKKLYGFNHRKLNNHLPYVLPRSPTTRVRQSEIWVQDYHLERSIAYGKGAGSNWISLPSRKGLWKRSMSAPALHEIRSFRNDTLQQKAAAAYDESLGCLHLKNSWRLSEYSWRLSLESDGSASVLNAFVLLEDAFVICLWVYGIDLFVKSTKHDQTLFYQKRPFPQRSLLCQVSHTVYAWRPCAERTKHPLETPGESKFFSLSLPAALFLWYRSFVLVIYIVLFRSFISDKRWMRLPLWTLGG